MKINKTEICKKYNISYSTLNNWQRTKPLIYNLLINIDKQVDELDDRYKDILFYFSQIHDMDKDIIFLKVKTAYLEKLKEEQKQK